MMKKAIKKLMAAALAIAMLCAMAVPAFAADSNPGKIIIDNAVSGQTYTIYRILDLEYNEVTQAYRYTMAEKWKAFSSTDLAIDAKTGTVTWANADTNNGTSAAIQAFANAAGSWAKDNSIVSDGQQKATSSTVTFNSLPLGWYLVISDLSNGVICSIDTTDKEATIKEKNGQPTVEKEVLENSTNTYGKGNDGNVGDTVTFHATIKVTDGDPQNYVLHDTMSAGLTFTGITSVTRANGTETLNDTTYVLTQGDEVTDNCTFELAFNNGVLHPNDEVVVEYTAVINENAVIGSTGNTNEVILKYKDGTSSQPSTTKTYTWEINIYKFFKDSNGDKKPLEGATFVLYRQNASNEKEYAKISATKIEWFSEKDQATSLTSNEQGTIAINRLDAGTYYLEETQAPTGYNPLTSPIEITIAHSTLNDTNTTATITYKQSADSDATDIANTSNRVEVENKTGATLPSTGGIGTTIFYVVGGGLMVAAIVLLVTKKRMENK